MNGYMRINIFEFEVEFKFEFVFCFVLFFCFFTLGCFSLGGLIDTFLCFEIVGLCCVEGEG